MVNIRATVERALAEGVLSAAECQLLLLAAKSLYYPLRSYPAVLERAVEAGLSAKTSAAVRQWLPAGAVDRKRLDALSLLSVLRAFASRRRRRLKTNFPFHNTQMWDFGMRNRAAGREATGETP
jgi:hypothetical protein